MLAVSGSGSANPSLHFTEESDNLAPSMALLEKRSRTVSSGPENSGMETAFAATLSITAVAQLTCGLQSRPILKGAQVKFMDTGQVPGFGEEAATFAPSYVPEGELDGTEIHSALSSLALFKRPDLRIQSYNLGIVDRFITTLELTVLAQLNKCGEASAHEVAFLGAQSRMWLMATYELMRTWRGWATEIVELHRCGALKYEPELLEAPNPRSELLTWMVHNMQANPSVVFRLGDDLKRTHIAYTCLKHLCFALADQGPVDQREADWLGVNYVGINEWCGALDYKVTAGECTLSPINRRDIAEDIRAIADGPVPTGDQLANFDDFVRGRPLCELR